MMIHFVVLMAAPSVAVAWSMHENPAWAGSIASVGRDCT